jgi:ATP-dependent Clp protease ATP-binding subunit ClpB
MNLSKYTLKSQDALAEAQNIASQYSNIEIVPEHLLLALVKQDGGTVPAIIKKASAAGQEELVLSNIIKDLENEIEKKPKVSGANAYLSQSLTKILNNSEKTAKDLKDDYVSTEHILISEADAVSEKVSEILKKYGFTGSSILKILADIRGGQKVSDQNPEDKYQVLEKYGRDLTEFAKRGKLDPVIGRDEEIRRCMQVLSRRTKNNPVIIGEPGVGKTAIVEGLASRLVSGDAPECLKD